MNRLAVLLAAVGTLGTGCVVSDNTCNASSVSSRTVSIGWPSFLFYDGATTASCASANVDWIDVYMDDHRVANPASGTNGYWYCPDGGVDVTGVDNASSHLFTVEGIDRTTSAIALRDEVTVAPSCNVLVNTQPSEGTFTLNYTFNPNVCSSGSYIWFRVTDKISGDVISADESGNAASYLCTGGVSFRLASGSYNIDRTEEVVNTGTVVSPVWEARANNCTSADFAITGATQSIVDRPMTDAATFCP